ncbi:VWA domain-containing protein [Alteromonas pelagimontana]|uniref:VWA domain-containing protein n=1 Tax=Alteromonas pelagimontana TaxID=1858656 RepID=A0A6M4MB94_9ALTE|nr:VWA domain-containing protein [Alteromonas pelagimontana]QJR79870.1 VWA domain-containing protein [Alteromonas pelagimontana]
MMALWHDFHFLRPEWFVALIPLVVVFLLLRYWSQRQSGWQSVIASHLYSHLVAGKVSKNSKPPYWLLALGWTTAVTALAGPTWERLPQPVFQLKTGHVIVIDMSLSMRATDVAPDRLARAKYKAIDLINAVDEGEIGLIAYAGDAFAISPLTTDAATLTTLLPSLSPEIMPSPGSDPLLGLQTAADLLSNTGYQRGEIYWITDGVDMSQVPELRQYISDIPFTVNILGVGTSEGAPIKQINGELLKDSTGAIVIPKMNEDRLKGLSRAGNGKFITMSANERDVQYLTQRSLLSDQSEQSDEQANETGDQWAELGPYLLLLLLPFAAYAFRRGIVIVLAATLLFPPMTPPVMAQDAADATPPQEQVNPTRWWQRPFLNADQQGLAAFNQQAYSDAADEFEDPAWKGAAAYKAGNYEEALQAYSQLNTEDALYNQGNALAQLGELDEAIEKYNDVLAANPEHADAKANKALLEKLKEQQEKQQQNQQQEQQSEDNAQPQNGDGDQQQNQQEDSSGNSQQNQRESSGSDNQQQSQGEQQPSDSDAEQQGQKQDDSSNSKEEDGNAEQQPTTGQTEEDKQGEKDAQSMTAQPAEMSDEEREKQQRLENLMRKIPDDPAFLLKRKMQLEAQQRRRSRPPTNRSEW